MSAGLRDARKGLHDAIDGLARAKSEVPAHISPLTFARAEAKTLLRRVERLLLLIGDREGAGR